MIIWTHKKAIEHIAKQKGLNPKRVKQCVNSFFSFHGIDGLMKSGHTINLSILGKFYPNKKRKIIMKRQIVVNKLVKRLKFNAYYHKNIKV